MRSLPRVTFALGLPLLASACAPQLYQRSTVLLDHPDDEALTVRYGELDGCLFRHQIPVEYTVDRPRYRLVLRPVSSTTSQSAPVIEIRLEARGNASGLSLRFPDLAPESAPPARYAEPGQRYLLDTAALAGARSLRLQVLDGSSEIAGEERFSVEPDRCHVFSPMR